VILSTLALGLGPLAFFQEPEEMELEAELGPKHLEYFRDGFTPIQWDNLRSFLGVFLLKGE